MTIMHWKILIILYSMVICVFISCKKTEVYWNDLRENKEKVEFTLTFANAENDAYKNIKFKTNSTETIHLPEGYDLNEFESSSNMCVQILQNADNTKIEFFITDAEPLQELGYNTVLKEKEGVYCYYVSFANKEKNLICTLFSKDNKFSADVENLNTNNETNIQHYLSELGDADIGYYYEIEEGYVSSFTPSYGYFIESKISEYLLQVPALSTGRILPIIKKDAVTKSS